MSTDSIGAQEGAGAPTSATSRRASPGSEAQTIVRRLMVELALVEYALRYSVPTGVSARVLVERQRNVVAYLRSRQVPVTALGASLTPSAGRRSGTSRSSAVPRRTSADSDESCAALLERILHLERALEGRTVIGQAQGILMERHQLAAEQAFDRLRSRSQHLNRKLRDVAADLVSTGEEAPLRDQSALPRSAPGR